MDDFFENFLFFILFLAIAVFLSVVFLSIVNSSNNETDSKYYKSSRSDEKHIVWRLEQIENKIDKLLPAEK